MRGITKHLSYANVAATLALVFAMTGAAMAASGGFTSGGKLQACVGRDGSLKLLKSGKSCHRGQQKVAWSQTGPQGPAGPAGPSGLAGQSGTSPTIPGKVSAAETALTANNALALGGVPASEFTRRDCASTTGQIKGFASVPADAGFPSTFTPVSLSYNCSGGAVEAERVSTGLYEVRFQGNPAAITVATVNESGAEFPFPAAVSVSLVTNGEWLVRVHNAASNTEIDAPFSMILP